MLYYLLKYLDSLFDFPGSALYQFITFRSGMAFILSLLISTMCGIIIIMATLIPVLLLARLENIYVLVLILTTIWMGVIGFLDDYIKVFKKDKEGLKGKFKVVGQIGLGIIVGTIFYFHPNI